MGAITKAAEATPATTSVERTVAHLIEQQKGQIARALPRLMDPDRFARVLITECKANPALLKADPLSLMAAVMKAAALGVEPGPLGHSYLVPFKNNKAGGRTEVQFILGYKGMVDLARRSGKVTSLYADVVYEGDDFHYQLGLHRDLTHARRPGSNRDHITHAYAVAHYTDGGFDFVVLDELDLDARRKRSRASGQGPWVTDYAAMAQKSAVRALAKWLPLTVEAAGAISSDEQSYTIADEGSIVEATISDMAVGELTEAIHDLEAERPADVDDDGVIQAEVIES